jgi:butyryl-CoA dehydrogenase
MNKMAGYRACLTAMASTIEDASSVEGLDEFATQLTEAIEVLKTTTTALLTAMGSQNIDLAMANSVKYLELFGNVVVAWVWLRQGIVARRALEKSPHHDDEMFYRGKVQAMQYFFRFELTEIHAWSKLLCDIDDTTYAMQADWF